MKTVRKILVMLLLLGIVGCTVNESEGTEDMKPDSFELILQEEIDLKQYMTEQGYGEYVSGLNSSYGGFYGGMVEFGAKTLLFYPYYVDGDDVAQTMMITLDDFKPVDIKMISLDMERIFSAVIDEDGIITLVGGNYREFDEGRKDFMQIAQVTVEGEMLSNQIIRSQHSKSFIYHSVLGESAVIGMGTNAINTDVGDFYLVSVNADGTVNWERTPEDYGFTASSRFNRLYKVDDFIIVEIEFIDERNDNYGYYLLVLDEQGELVNTVLIEGVTVEHNVSVYFLKIDGNSYSIYMETGKWNSSGSDYLAEVKKQVQIYDEKGIIFDEVIMDDRYVLLEEFADGYIIARKFVKNAETPEPYYLLDYDLNVIEELEIENLNIVSIKENTVLSSAWDENNSFKYRIYEFQNNKD